MDNIKNDYALDMSKLVNQLRVKAGVMEMGERIAWGSDTALMRAAADKIEALDEWQPMNTAPKDRPILAVCVHSADPYYLDGGLTIYGAHAEGVGCAEDGLQLVEWGGEFDEVGVDGGYIPAWWFVLHSGFEKVANPVWWREIPPLPATHQRETTEGERRP